MSGFDLLNEEQKTVGYKARAAVPMMKVNSIVGKSVYNL
jgi:hypothetical protein